MAISANKAASYLITKARSSGAFVYTVYNHLYNTLVLPIIEYSIVSSGDLSHLITYLKSRIIS